MSNSCTEHSEDSDKMPAPISSNTTASPTSVPVSKNSCAQTQETSNALANCGSTKAIHLVNGHSSGTGGDHSIDCSNDHQISQHENNNCSAPSPNLIKNASSSPSNNIPSSNCSQSTDAVNKHHNIDTAKSPPPPASTAAVTTTNSSTNSSVSPSTNANQSSSSSGCDDSANSNSASPPPAATSNFVSQNDISNGYAAAVGGALSTSQKQSSTLTGDNSSPPLPAVTVPAPSVSPTPLPAAASSSTKPTSVAPSATVNPWLNNKLASKSAVSTVAPLPNDALIISSPTPAQANQVISNLGEFVKLNKN